MQETEQNNREGEITGRGRILTVGYKYYYRPTFYVKM